MPKKKIDYSKEVKKETIQIVNNSSGSSNSPVSSPKSSFKSSSKPRTEKQKAAAKANLEKARKAKENYYLLRRRGFDQSTIYAATMEIEDYLSQSDSMRTDNNPAVARLYQEIGDFKTESELASMTKGEFYRYASSIREFLNNPISVEEAADFLHNSLRSSLIKAELVISPGETEEGYKTRRRKLVKSHEEVSKKAFELYRRVMETNAGQIIKAKFSPAAYGSDNLIADLFDFASQGDWNPRYNDTKKEWDDEMSMAVDYWSEIIDEQYRSNLEELQMSHSREAIELKQFAWKGGESYASFVRRRRGK